LTESVETVHQTQQLRPDLIAGIVINGKEGRTALARGGREAIGSFGLPVLRSEITQRVAFAEACAEGKGVTTYAPKTPAAAELRALCDEIETMVGLKEVAA